MEKLDDKYSYSRDDNGVLHLYRNGENCDNLISNPLISAIYKIEESEEDIKELREKVENQKSFLKRIRAKFELGELEKKEIEGYFEGEQLTKAKEIIKKYM